MDSNQLHLEIEAALVMSQLDLAARSEALERALKGESLAQIYQSWKDQARPQVLSLLGKFNPEHEVMTCAAKKIEMICLTDSAYPDLLRSISDPPFILYAKGKTELMHDLSIAVVGSRHASFYGLEQARRFSRVLSDAGLTIVSGLALGIDQAAHESALDGKGNTIAVLGCGIDVVYPAENRKLFERIEKEGLILSEYALGAEPRAYHFPRRNRILSGLSLGVLVVEAHERSGSLITAYQALEQGREVFAIPGPVHHITSRGTHRIIREGATLVEAPEEIILAVAENSGVLQFQSQPKVSRPRSPAKPVASIQTEMPLVSDSDSSHPLVEVLKKQSQDYEGLFELSKMEPHEFAQTLTELEIEGKIQKNQYGFYEAT